MKKHWRKLALIVMALGLCGACEDPPPPDCGPLTMQEFCDSNP